MRKQISRPFQSCMKLAMYVLPWRMPETLEGIGAIKQLPAFVKEKGNKKAFIVTDKTLMNLHLLDDMLHAMEEMQLPYELFDKVTPNPTDVCVEEGVALYKKHQCDCIIAFGGGSPMDCAKGIAARIARPNKSIKQLQGVLRVLRPVPTIYAVPTTAGTGSETTIAAVITCVKNHHKASINDICIMPKYAVLDPELTVGLPPYTTATTGMDALTHAVEAYVSIAATPMTDACAEKAIEYISRFLRRAVANGSDKEAREGMCYAQYLAGMAFNNASLGHVHAMAHQLGGFYDLPHGFCNAILLPHVCEYNLIGARRRFARIARMLGERTDNLTLDEAALAAVKAIKKLSKDVDIPSGIKALGDMFGKQVSMDDIPTMVANAQKDACGLTNPRKMSDAAVTAIYCAAW